MRRHSRKKDIIDTEPINCIAILGSGEHQREDRAEQIENKQLNRINEFADRNNLVIKHVLRYGVMGCTVRSEIFARAVRMLSAGKAEALVVTNVDAISNGIRDSYYKVGTVHEAGFRLLSVDEKEPRLNLYIPPKRKECEVYEG